MKPLFFLLFLCFNLTASEVGLYSIIINEALVLLKQKNLHFLTTTSLIAISSLNTILLLINFTKSLIHKYCLHKYNAIIYATATQEKPIFLTNSANIFASILPASDTVFATFVAVVASLIIVPVLINTANLKKHFHNRKFKLH